MISLVAFVIGTIGCPILGQRPDRDAKRGRHAVQRTEPVEAARDQSENALPVPKAPSEEAPIVGLVIQAQPQAPVSSVAVPMPETSGRLAPIAIVRRDATFLPPDTPPPRSSIG